MIHQGTQTITTERLTLRRFTVHDAKAMFDNWASDPRVTRYLTWEPHESVKVTRDLLYGWCSLYANPAYYHWCIELDGQAIGGINVVRQNNDHEFAELGYCIGYDYWHRGIVTEAAQAVIDYLFDKVGVHRVTIRHAVNNPASGRVAAKCGMTFEGILREEYKSPSGEFWDMAVHGILRKEWEEQRANRDH